jgi:hypothetical protein
LNIFTFLWLAVRKTRKALGVEPSMKRVDTCAAEFDANTPYMYSSYDGECETQSDSEPKVGLLLLLAVVLCQYWLYFQIMVHIT